MFDSVCLTLLGPKGGGVEEKCSFLAALRGALVLIWLYIVLIVFPSTYQHGFLFSSSLNGFQSVRETVNKCEIRLTGRLRNHSTRRQHSGGFTVERSCILLIFQSSALKFLLILHQNCPQFPLL